MAPQATIVLMPSSIDGEPRASLLDREQDENVLIDARIDGGFVCYVSQGEVIRGVLWPAIRETRVSISAQGRALRHDEVSVAEKRAIADELFDQRFALGEWAITSSRALVSSEWTLRTILWHGLAANIASGCGIVFMLLLALIVHDLLGATRPRDR